MAKKDSIEMPVEERLKTLYQLQATLSEIDEKRALRGELPLEVQDLEDEIEGLSTRIEKIQNDINEYERAVTQKKGEIETAKASVERYKAQLDEVKNNREYDTLSKEIEYQTLEIELCNKKIKEAAFKIDYCEYPLRLPNAITPSNEDGLNDYFYIPEIMAGDWQTFEIAIYDRWGEQVYVSSNKGFHWDGRVRDKLPVNAVYTWIIHCTNAAGKPMVYRGELVVL